MSLDHTQLILLAQSTAPVRNPLLDTLPMMVLMVVIFYFLLIRPQQKKAKEHTKMVDALKSGASVVTRGGVVGTVQSVKDTTVSVRSLESKFEVEKHAIERVINNNSDSKDRQQVTQNRETKQSSPIPVPAAHPGLGRHRDDAAPGSTRKTDR